MPEVESYTPGTPCWVELATRDGQAAVRFYGSLFGWAVDVTAAGGAEPTHTRLHLRGKDVAGLCHLDAGGQAPPAAAAAHWRTYVSVASADDAAARAARLGGRILQEPREAGDAGRMAVLADPAGTAFAVWQPRRRAGAGLVNEPGTWCWNELAAADTQAASDFYGRLFEWDAMVQDLDGWQYTTFTNQGRPAAGMVRAPAGSPAPPAWLAYFAIADCDSGCDQARGLGATLTVAACDIPGVGRFAILADPQGAAFGLIQLSQLP